MAKRDCRSGVVASRDNDAKTVKLINSLEEVVVH